MSCNAPIVTTVFVPLLHPQQLSQFQILLETNVMPRPSSDCCLSPHILAAGYRVAITAIQKCYTFCSEIPNSGQDTQVLKDSLIHPLVTLILPSKSVHLQQNLYTHTSIIHQHLQISTTQRTKATTVSALPSP